MSVGVFLPNWDNLNERTAFASRVEGFGYDSVWTGELWGVDSFVQLTDIANETSQITLGTGITNVYSRSPAVLTMAAASLKQVAGDRVILGIGASTPTVVEQLHGLDYDRPATRVQETLELIRRYADGDGRISYDGSIFRTSGFPPLNTDFPVYNAALGPRNRHLTGRLADGWLPSNLPSSGLAEAFEAIEAGAQEYGRDADDIAVKPVFPTAVSDDPDEAYALVRDHVAYYVGTAESYKRAFAIRYPEIAEQVHDAWQAGDRDAARSALIDDIIDDVGIAGTPTDATDRLRELEAEPLIDEVVLMMPEGSDEPTVERTIEALAPSHA